MRKILVLSFVVFLTLFSMSSQSSAQDTSDPRYMGQIIASMIPDTDEEVEFLDLTLAFNAMVDPEIDQSAVRSEIEAMAKAISSDLEPNATDIQKLTALQKFLYEAGPWNDHRAFGYNHDDPLGTYMSNKLMHTYLSERQGNCVSMPTLFLILGDMIGLNLTLSTAPNHVFLHYESDDGRLLNIEATSGGHPFPHSTIIEQFDIAPRTIESGMFLKKLDRRQTAAILASIVLEDRLQRKQYGSVIHIAEALANIYPEYSLPLIARGLAFQNMLRKQFGHDLSNPNIRNDYERDVFNTWALQADASFRRVALLGLEPDAID